MIEQWSVENNGFFPEELHIQCDGGNENANKYVLAFLEHLTARRIVKRVFYTRLPVAHTHEDIDQCFSVVAVHFTDRTVNTVDEYTEELIKAFMKKSIEVNVKDVYVVPDYRRFYTGCIDTKLSKLHKTDNTQLRWRFEAVPVNNDFPLGAKATYRAFRSDKVIEIKKKNKMQCTSDLGQLTGLEPVTTVVRWEPSESRVPGMERVEGMYVLKAFPQMNNGSLHSIPPKDFDQDGIIQLNSLFRNSLSKIYPINSLLYIWWRDWIEKKMPNLAQSAEDYVQTHPYHVPLEFVIDSRTANVNFWDLVEPLTSIQPAVDFVWPTLIQVSTASVEWERVPHGSPPRIMVTAEESLQIFVNKFIIRSESYYARVLKPMTNIKLKATIKRKMTDSGGSIPHGSTKDELLIVLKSWDKQFITHRYRTLQTQDLQFIERLLNLQDQRIAASREVVNIAYNGVVIRIIKSDLQVFKDGTDLSQKIFNAIMLLFQTRDTVMCKAHEDVNKNCAHYTKRLPSIFFDLNFAAVNMNRIEEVVTSEVFRLIFEKLEDYHRIYIPFFSSENTFGLCIIDIALKRILYIDPRYGGSNSPEITATVECVKLKLLRLMNSCNSSIIERNWTAMLYPNWANIQCYEKLIDSCDSGINILVIVDMMYNDVPIVFEQVDMEIFRLAFCHYLVQNDLPL